jgi:cell division septal protein FtsQ
MPDRDRLMLLVLLAIPIVVIVHVALFWDQSTPYMAMLRDIPANGDTTVRTQSQPLLSSRYDIVSKTQRGS